MRGLSFGFASAPGRARRRWVFLGAATLGVVGLHLLLLMAWAPAWIDPDMAPAVAPPALQVRSVAAPPPAVAEAAREAPAPVAILPPRAPLRPAPSKPADAPMPAPNAVAAEPSPAEAPAPAPEAVVATEPTAAPTIEVPVYSTKLSAPGTWRYRMQRGLVSGEATLTWQPRADARYDLRLEGRVAGLTVLDWVSTGAIDAHGIAPERFVIRRRGRDQQAANFQRDADKITFSGPTHELPLVAGVQDRLSWMLQLPAVIDAAPSRFGAGARIAMMVVGARGGADVWHFAVVGTEPVGETPALKLLREARRPYDTKAEVWLDPVRGHLPLRAVLTQAEGGAALELQLDN